MPRSLMMLLDRLRTLTVSRPHHLEYTACCANLVKYMVVSETLCGYQIFIWLIGWYGLASSLVLPEGRPLLYRSHISLTVTYLFILAPHILRRLFPNNEVSASNNILLLGCASALSAASLIATGSLYHHVEYWVASHHSKDREWYAKKFLLLMLVLPLAIFYVMVTSFKWVRLVVQRLHMRNYLGHHQDEKTSLAMVYQRELLKMRFLRYGKWQEDEKKKVRQAPVNTSRKQPSGFVYHSRERLPRGTALPQDQFEKLQRNTFPYFLRCGCCVDLASILPDDLEVGTQARSNLSPALHSEWHSTRDEFLQRPTVSHLCGLPSDTVPRLHRLCSKCKKLCVTSQILRFEGQSNFRHKFRLRLRDLEVFVHWETAGLMFQNAQSGCHLCTLFWNSMNDEQQQILLRGDRKLELDLQRELEFAHNAIERADIRRQFLAQRSITIVVESLAIDSADKPDLPIDFNMASKHSLQVTPYAQLIPHFGALKRPRRWIRTVRGFEHILYEGESEFADPIYIIPAKLEGTLFPVITPFSAELDARLQLQMGLLLCPLHTPQDPMLRLGSSSNGCRAPIPEITRSPGRDSLFLADL